MNPVCIVTKAYVVGETHNTPEECGKTLTVGELIKELQKFNVDMPVFLELQTTPHTSVYRSIEEVWEDDLEEHDF